MTFTCCEMQSCAAVIIRSIDWHALIQQLLNARYISFACIEQKVANFFCYSGSVHVEVHLKQEPPQEDSQVSKSLFISNHNDHFQHDITRQSPGFRVGGVEEKIGALTPGLNILKRSLSEDDKYELEPNWARRTSCCINCSVPAQVEIT